MGTDATLIIYLTPAIIDAGKLDAVVDALEADDYGSEWDDRLNVTGAGKHWTYNRQSRYSGSALDTLTELGVPFEHMEGPDAEGWDENDGPDQLWYHPDLGHYETDMPGRINPSHVLRLLEGREVVSTAEVRRVVDNAVGGPWRRTFDALADALAPAPAR